MGNISKTEATFENLILNLKKKQKDRSQKDISIISKFLEQTHLHAKFKNDNIDDSAINRMIYFCSVYMNYQFIEKHKILFRTGDRGDKFFIIFKGKVSILKPQSRIESMTISDYINYLTHLRETNEKYLLEKTIEANEDKFPISMQDIHDLEEICFQIKYRKTLVLRPSVEQLQKVFQDGKRDPRKYSVDLQHLYQMTKGDQGAIDRIVDSQLSQLSRSTFLNIEKYRFMENDLDSKQVVLYYNEEFMFKSSGQYFGDFAIDGFTNKRSATIIADEDTYLGYLHSDIYKQYVSIEQQRLTQKEVNFFLENFFFTSVQKKAFEKRYFNQFVCEDFFRGSVIFTEGEEMKYLYIVKEGEIELSICKSLLEIHKLSKYLISVNPGKIPNDYQLRNEPKNFMEDLNKKKKVKLFIYSNKEVLGLEEFFFGLNRLYTAKILSEKAKVYKIALKDLLILLKEEKECFQEVEQSAKLKMISFVKRLVDIKNISLSMIDDNITRNDQMEKKRIKDEEKMEYFKNSVNSKVFQYSSSVNQKKEQPRRTVPSSLTNTKKINQPLIIGKEILDKHKLVQAKHREPIQTEIFMTEEAHPFSSPNNKVNTQITFKDTPVVIQSAEVKHIDNTRANTKVRLPVIKDNKDDFNFENKIIRKLENELKIIKAKGYSKPTLNNNISVANEYNNGYLNTDVSDQTVQTSSRNFGLYRPVLTEESEKDNSPTFLNRANLSFHKVALLNFSEYNQQNSSSQNKNFYSPRKIQKRIQNIYINKHQHDKKVYRFKHLNNNTSSSKAEEISVIDPFCLSLKNNFKNLTHIKVNKSCIDADFTKKKNKNEKKLMPITLNKNII
jgi:CRP-like cAMP-binding protein